MVFVVSIQPLQELTAPAIVSNLVVATVFGAIRDHFPGMPALIIAFHAQITFFANIHFSSSYVLPQLFSDPDA